MHRLSTILGVLVLALGLVACGPPVPTDEEIAKMYNAKGQPAATLNGDQLEGLVRALNNLDPNGAADEKAVQDTVKSYNAIELGSARNGTLRYTWFNEPVELNMKIFRKSQDTFQVDFVTDNKDFGREVAIRLARIMVKK